MARSAGQVARRAISLLVSSSYGRSAVYRANQDGLALVAARRGVERWDVPPTLEPMPPELSILEEESAPETVSLSSNTGALSNTTAAAIRGPDGLLGILIVERPPENVEEAVDLSLAVALIGSCLRLEAKRHMSEGGHTLPRRARALEATGRLSAGIAHELNNPLNVVKGLAELMTLDESASEHIRRDARLISEEASRAVTVVRQLLSYGRADNMVEQIMDLREVVDCCVSVFETTTRQTGLQIEREISRSPVEILGDPYRMQQAVLAILDNARLAIKDSSTGEGSVRVVLQTSGCGNNARLEFTDSGPGIDTAVMPHVFDPFFTTREPGEGSGMGLALVDRAIRDIGGSIECGNVPGSGACFCITIQLSGRSHVTPMGAHLG
jgi:signal transduction histidine kinase